LKAYTIHVFTGKTLKGAGGKTQPKSKEQVAKSKVRGIQAKNCRLGLDFMLLSA